MKKFLVFIVLLALTTPFIFAEDVEAVAGETNYKIDAKLHNYVQSAYSPKFAFEICLPVAEKFKMYVDMAFENTATFNKAATMVGTVKSAQEWSAINNYLKFYIGLPLTDTFQLSLMVGGGTDIGTYNLVDYDGTVETTKEGVGQIFVELGIVLKSAMFGSKLDDLKIRYTSWYNLAGNGAYNSTFAAIGIANTVLSQGGNSGTDNLYQYFGLNEYLQIGTGIPFDVGLPKLDLGFEIGGGITSVSYSTASINGTAVYLTNPSYLKGMGYLKINLGINPASNIETNTYIKPGFDIEQYSWKVDGATDTSTASLPKFTFGVGADWKATFAKIVYLKLDAQWNLTAGYTGFALTGSNLAFVTGASGISSVLDPGITLGFNFEGWTLEMKWSPTYVYTVYNNAQNANVITSVTDEQQSGIRNTTDSNVWNLSNWEFSVSCSFPPPKK